MVIHSANSSPYNSAQSSGVMLLGGRASVGSVRVDKGDSARMASRLRISPLRNATNVPRRLPDRSTTGRPACKTRAAELFELSSRSLLYKIREYGLE
jgi:hypothetical protein